MPGPIEDYALVGDCEAAALIGRDGSVDWLCWPRFDSGACFAALLGNPGNGRWRIAPVDPNAKVTRRYLPDTLVLETCFATDEGEVAIIDFMPRRGRAADLVRIVEGRRGSVRMAMELILRFDYGSAVPWVTRDNGDLRAIAGPDLVVLRTPAELHGEDFKTLADFEVKAGEKAPFVLSYGPSHLPPPPPIDPFKSREETESFWREWSQASDVTGPYADLVKRSLLVLKALTYAPTGGIVAAVTTSLPEQLGGTRNWDYRYCWIRDATLTLLELIDAKHFEEADAWAHWLQRAVAGSPEGMQIMYGIAGERRLTEWEVPWLDGYQGARPVRIGNGAHQQFQLDVYGELMDTFYQARLNGLLGDRSWGLELAIMDHVAKVWTAPDEGIWEVRGGRRHFTFSKVMAWVAVDRAIKSLERFDLPGPIDEWRALCREIHADICRNGINPKTGGFQRAYDDPHADASLLLLAELGFVAPDDPRFAATVAAVENELVSAHGLVARYDTTRVNDGLPPGEGAFLPCSFWLANAYTLLGRHEEARKLFEHLLGFCNDVGLLAEEFDPEAGRLTGNFPQAFSHVALISTAMNLTHTSKPTRQRAGQEEPAGA